MLEDPAGNGIDFSEKLVDILNFGALNLALGIGYRCGLFEALDTFEVHRTAAAIAKRRG